MEYLHDILLTLGLVLLNGFFVAAEFAAVGARRTRLEEIKGDGLLEKLALNVKDSLDLYLSACQLGITIASLALGFVTEHAVLAALQPILGSYRWFAESHGAAAITALTISTALHVSIGEVAPKNIAIRVADRILPWLAPPLIAFTYLFYPAIWILNSFSNLLLRLVGFRVQDVAHAESLHSAGEIQMLLEQSIEEGEIKPARGRLLSSAFRFDELTANQIMTPRPDVKALAVDDSLSDVINLVRNSAYTRFPVYEGEIDNVIGLVHMKDIFNLFVAQNEAGHGSITQTIDLHSIKRTIHIVPESLPVPRLLRRFQRSSTHMAAVVNEHGSFEGVVTLEDVIEELVGEIDDEFDEKTPALIERIENGYRAYSNVPLYQLAEQLDITDLEVNQATTLNGYLVQALGHLPFIGDKVRIGHYDATVLNVTSRRVSEVELVERADRSED